MTLLAAPALAAIALLAWAYLLLAHGRFWQAGPVLHPARPSDSPAPMPAVDVVIPARDEAAGIEAALRSLLAQDYPGPLRLVVVDDRSTDGTGAIARALLPLSTAARALVVLDGKPRPPGWSGKLWAVQQGIAFTESFDPGVEAAAQAAASHGEPVIAGRVSGAAIQGPPAPPVPPAATRNGPAQHAAGTPAPVQARAPLVLLTDADILHAPAHVSTLVAKAERDGLDLVSEMVALHCVSVAERALVPAFVFFFQMLYPFARVNDTTRATAAAAGGTMLVRRRALDRIGGIAAIRGALIDDVALAAAIKRGGRIWLGHSATARSLRPYPAAADIWRMVARTAYVQLRRSPLVLAGTVAGLALVWLAPPALALFAHGPARWMGALAWAGSAAAYLPTLRRFGQSPLWAILLPGIAAFYMAATLGSAWDHHRGRGATWKRRAYRDAAA